MREELRPCRDGDEGIPHIDTTFVPHARHIADIRMVCRWQTMEISLHHFRLIACQYPVSHSDILAYGHKAAPYVAGWNNGFAGHYH